MREEDLGHYSNSCEDIVDTNRDYICRRSNESYKDRSLSALKHLTSTLIFLGTLKPTYGILTSAVCWVSLESDLCSLIYLKRRFDCAISEGNDLPSINITSVLGYFFSKSKITNTSFPLNELDPEDRIENFFM
ncbi:MULTISPECIES: hypothetical protein [Candidatus Ichthyocystis]|uniref:Uncharacterized protein n=1 Tax=Candidatus Ichthyocystis hellenicum TaxID=1561003 RepID=A0A0S4M3V8_9BURK|nr:MULTISPECIES: hypothetical protein [Ichthyocystis]CUT18366.1 hypothetical protein Ark11_1573 [Candidatus Ichthyocystis hellenicum]